MGRSQMAAPFLMGSENVRSGLCHARANGRRGYRQASRGKIASGGYGIYPRKLPRVAFVGWNGLVRWHGKCLEMDCERGRSRRNNCGISPRPAFSPRPLRFGGFSLRASTVWLRRLGSPLMRVRHAPGIPLPAHPSTRIHGPPLSRLGHMCRTSFARLSAPFPARYTRLSPGTLCYALGNAGGGIFRFFDPHCLNPARSHMGSMVWPMNRVNEPYVRLIWPFVL